MKDCLFQMDSLALQVFKRTLLSFLIADKFPNQLLIITETGGTSLNCSHCGGKEMTGKPTYPYRTLRMTGNTFMCRNLF